MLFPESQRALEMYAAESPVFAEGYDIEAAREQSRALAAQEPREEVGEVADVDADGVPARLYIPDGAGQASIVHSHGGGFVFNDVEVHDASARRLANRSGMRVLSVDSGPSEPSAGRWSRTATAPAGTSRWSTRSATRGGTPRSR